MQKSKRAVVVAIANRKGGVGKSTTAVHLAAALGQAGRPSLVVDLDSQANATLVLSSKEALLESGPSTANVLAGEATLDDVLRPTTAENVWLAPADRALTAAVMAIQGRAGRETMLRRSMKTLRPFDFVLVDTPPESHLGTANALVAADFVVVPFTPEPTALHGLVFVQEILEDVVASGLNPEVRLVGCLQVAYDRRLNATERARQDVRQAVHNLLLEAVVRANARFLDCAAVHRTVFDLEAGGERRGSEDYMAAALELSGRMGV